MGVWDETLALFLTAEPESVDEDKSSTNRQIYAIQKREGDSFEVRGGHQGIWKKRVNRIFVNSNLTSSSGAVR